MFERKKITFPGDFKFHELTKKCFEKSWRSEDYETFKQLPSIVFSIGGKSEILAVHGRLSAVAYSQGVGHIMVNKKHNFPKAESHGLL